MNTDRNTRIAELATAYQVAADGSNIRSAQAFAAELRAFIRGAPSDSKRCSRCHQLAPNPNGCALCNPEHLGERLRVALAVIDNLRSELESSRAEHAVQREAWAKSTTATNRRIAELEARVRDLQETYRG